MDVQPPPRRFGVAFTPFRSDITIDAVTISPRTTAHNSLAMSSPEKEPVVADQERDEEAPVADQERDKEAVDADQEQEAVDVEADQ